MNLNSTETPKLTHRFEEALVYTNRLHRKQTRKGGNVPYISHLLSVAALVLEDGGDEDEEELLQLTRIESTLQG